MTGGALPELGVPRLIIWRHGRTEWNAAGRFQGQLDPPLDDVGRHQAVRSAPHLVATGLTAENTVVVASDLRRAAETAATLSSLLGVPVQLDERLREHGMGTWEGLTRPEVADRYPEQYADWMSGRPVRGRGGEDSAAVAERAVAALADLPPVATAVVVTHGGTAGRLIERLLELGSDHRRVFGPLGNCAWSELRMHGTSWRLWRHNSSAFPQPDDGRREGVAASAPMTAGASPDEAAPPAQDADAVG